MWKNVIEASPEFATAIQSRFAAGPHHVLATLTHSGAPRTSGTEVGWWNDDVFIGSMPGSMKSSDLRRNPRFSVHSRPDDIEMVHGDAKLSGVVILEEHPALLAGFSEHRGHPPSADVYDLFRLDINHASLVRVSDDKTHLVIESWSPTSGYQRRERH